MILFSEFSSFIFLSLSENTPVQFTTTFAQTVKVSFDILSRSVAPVIFPSAFFVKETSST